MHAKFYFHFFRILQWIVVAEALANHQQHDKQNNPHPLESSSSSPLSPSKRLLQLIKSKNNNNNTTTNPPAIILPGVHDALSAKIYANSGAKAIFLSGFGVSATRLGQPDMGLLTLTEMEDALRSVVTSSSSSVNNINNDGFPMIPVIVDGDTGYGGAVNMKRMVQSFTAAGAAAITIEDQVFPKTCTYAAGGGVRVVSREDSLCRIKAAIEARDEQRQHNNNNDVLIIARTDCRAALGLEEAIARCQLYEEAGADIVYAENLQSREEYVRLRSELREETITMLAQVQLGGDEGGNQILYSVEEVGEMGYDLALFGITGLQAAVAAMKASADAMMKGSGDGDKSAGCDGDGLIPPSTQDTHDTTVILTSFSDLKQTIGFEDSESFQSKYEL